MSKFIENAIAKQEQAYTLTFAKKNYLYSCDYCASHNCLRCTCDVCPITSAYNKAIKEITEGQRKKPQNDVRTYRDEKGHVTVCISHSSNVIVNINSNSK